MRTISCPTNKTPSPTASGPLHRGQDRNSAACRQGDGGGRLPVPLPQPGPPDPSRGHLLPPKPSPEPLDDSLAHPGFL